MRRIASSVRFPLTSVQAKASQRCAASVPPFAAFSSSIRRPPVTSATAVAAAQAANPQPALSPTVPIDAATVTLSASPNAAAAAAAAAIDAATAAHTVALKAYYVARGIDIHRIQGKVYKPYNLARREYQAKSVTITLNKELNQYISVFKYGSIVFFNIPEEHHTQHIQRISEEAGFELIPETQQHTEMYKIVINPQLATPSVLKAEHLNILSLDTNNLTIASTVMAQSVALDFYAMTVDRMLEAFMQMNLKIQSTGNFNELNNAELYKMVASNHSVMTNVLLKMGIFEGTDAAWDNADYYTTWEGLRKDFEIDFRYKDLSLKLDIVKDDARFFLEVLHNQKSTKMELIIIALIAGEMVIGLLSLAKGAI